MNVGETTTEPSVTLETVSPARATEWLRRNESNRKLRQTIVDRYASDLLNGRWTLTGDPVQFSRNGRLQDGQHRLHAIVRANVTTQLFVVTGLTETAQQYIDQGVARTAGDALGIAGHANANLLASSARVAVQVESGALFRDRSAQTVSHGQILDWLDENPGMIECVKYISTAPQNESPLSPSVSAYAFYRFSEIDLGQAMDFFSRLGNGAALGPDSPLLTLRRKLTSAATKQQRLTRRDSLWLVFRTWNACRRGESLRRILRPQGRMTSLPELI